jgi:hypothetical protein
VDVVLEGDAEAGIVAVAVAADPERNVSGTLPVALVTVTLPAVTGSRLRATRTKN